MSEQDEKRDERRTRHGFWFGVFLGAGLAAILGTAVLVTAKVSAAPSASMAALHHGFRSGGLQDPEKAKERAEFAVAFVLGRVGATEDQQSQATEIVTRTIDDLVPLKETHQANRETLRTELARADIDPEAIELWRQSEMALADTASRELSQALIELAQTLTPEQRAELSEMAESFHR